MFNPEKVLGSLLVSRTRRSGGKSNLMSGGVLLGLVGVAMEAVDHYMNKESAAPPPVPGTSPGPPPPPGGKGTPGTPPPPPPQKAPFDHQAKQKANDRAMLLIRAMIAAANADGQIDQEERKVILEQVAQSGLDEQDMAFFSRELDNPLSMQAIVDQVDSPELATQVYSVSMAAIEVDTEAEKLYLERLAEALGLSDAQLASIHEQLG